MVGRKLRVAWFTPLARSGDEAITVSHYWSDLLSPRMRAEFDIEIFSGLLPGNHLGIPRYSTLNAYQRHRLNPFDIFFYQIEDSAQSRCVRTQVGMMPGITWMHDTFLKDPGAEAIHVSPWERTVHQMLDLSLPFFERDTYPLRPEPTGVRETSVSPVILFNSKWARDSLQSFISGRSEYIPGGHVSEYLPVPVSVASDERLVKKDRPLQILAMGSVLLEGRAHKFLPAIADTRTPCRLTWLVDPGERLEALRLAQEFGVSERVTLVEGNDPDKWRALVAQSDLAFLLNSHRHGRLAPYLELSMAASVPVVVMRCAGYERISQDAVFTIEPGLHETAQLVGILDAISTHNSRIVGRAGQLLVQRENSPEFVASKLGAIFRDSAPLLADVMKAWDGLYARARGALLEEIKGLVDSPVGGLPGAFEMIVEPFAAELADKF